MCVTLVAIITTLVTIIGLYSLYNYGIKCGSCTCKSSMKDKVVIVTGANSGIGYETAKDLAARGAKVFLACRDLNKGTTARNDIIEATNNSNVVLKHLDLSSFKSIRKFAEDFLNNEPKLHVLYNNAGTSNLDNSNTEDGLPVEMQVNYFGPFLLTMLLLPLLKTSAPSRIINMSSVLHFIGSVDTRLFDKPARNSMQHLFAYSNSKLANILFTSKLSKELEGTGVTVNCLHPGGVNSLIFRNEPFIVKLIVRYFFSDASRGAQTSIHMAVSPEMELVSGKYFNKCRETTPFWRARDQANMDKLWKLSNNVVFR